jgi:hypothetical protein
LQVDVRDIQGRVEEDREPAEPGAIRGEESASAAKGKKSGRGGDAQELDNALQKKDELAGATRSDKNAGEEAGGT